MKKTNLVIVITFFILAIYFAIFNWDVFILQLNVSLWFTSVTLPLIAFIFLLCLVFLVFQWGTAMLSDISNEKMLTKKDEEINTIKATYYDSNENRLQQISESIEQLFARIDDLSKQIAATEKQEGSDLKVKTDLSSDAEND